MHGVGEHSGRYDEVANAMTSLGVEVVSYDQRGFGESEGDRGEIPATDTLVADAAMVFDLVRREAPRDPTAVPVSPTAWEARLPRSA